MSHMPGYIPSIPTPRRRPAQLQPQPREQKANHPNPTTLLALHLAACFPFFVAVIGFSSRCQNPFVLALYVSRSRVSTFCLHIGHLFRVVSVVSADWRHSLQKRWPARNKTSVSSRLSPREVDKPQCVTAKAVALSMQIAHWNAANSTRPGCFAGAATAGGAGSARSMTSSSSGACSCFRLSPSDLAVSNLSFFGCETKSSSSESSESRMICGRGAAWMRALRRLPGVDAVEARRRLLPCTGWTCWISTEGDRVLRWRGMAAAVGGGAFGGGLSGSSLVEMSRAGWHL
jgi:hypothetical protein